MPPTESRKFKPSFFQYTYNFDYKNRVNIIVIFILIYISLAFKEHTERIQCFLNEMFF